MNRRLLLWLPPLLIVFLAFMPGSSPVHAASCAPTEWEGAAPESDFSLQISHPYHRCVVSWKEDPAQRERIRYYLIQRQDQSSDFYIIGGMKHLPPQADRHFEDIRPIYSDKVTYRVIAVLYDGTRRSSELSSYVMRHLPALDVRPLQAREYEVSLPLPVREGVLTVSNLQGQVLMQREWHGQHGTVDLRSLPSGVMFVRVRSGRYLWSRKVLLP